MVRYFIGSKIFISFLIGCIFSMMTVGSFPNRTNANETLNKPKVSQAQQLRDKLIEKYGKDYFRGKSCDEISVDVENFLDENPELCPKGCVVELIVITSYFIYVLVTLAMGVAGATWASKKAAAQWIWLLEKLGIKNKKEWGEVRVSVNNIRKSAFDDSRNCIWELTGLEGKVSSSDNYSLEENKKDARRVFDELLDQEVQTRVMSREKAEEFILKKIEKKLPYRFHRVSADYNEYDTSDSRTLYKMTEIGLECIYEDTWDYSSDLYVAEADKKKNDELTKAPSRKGNAPIGDDGYPIELHHEGQVPYGTIIEMTRTEHRGAGNDLINHPDKHTCPSKINRDKWPAQKERYWKQEYESGRFDELIEKEKEGLDDF